MVLTAMQKICCELVALKPVDRNPPLFCIDDGKFRLLATAMRTKHSVYGLRSTDINESYASLSIEDLAASYLQKIRTVQKHGPYQLIGYSFGGVIAFEIGALLLNSGEHVGILALVDTIHPLFYRNLSPVESKRFRQKYIADRTKKYLTNFFRGRLDLVASDGFRHVGTKLKPSAQIVRQRVYEALGRQTPVNESLNLEYLWHSYIEKKLPGRLTLFRVEKAMDAGSELDDDPTLGWGKYALKGVDVQYVDGTHETVVKMPSVLDLAEKLAPYLAETE
jgi:thioesterase domain-containing protein